MRSITIIGKHNIDELNKIGNSGHKSIRKHMTFLNESSVTHVKQVQFIGELYMNMETDINFNVMMTDTEDKLKYIIKSRLKSELMNKIQGYKQQDIHKDIHHHDTLITLEDVLEKLIGSKLTCCYCSKPILVLYKNVREPTQWTLDRIDNALSHTKENTCISCLKCNLQRRVMDAKKFEFTKKLVIQKME